MADQERSFTPTEPHLALEILRAGLFSLERGQRQRLPPAREHRLVFLFRGGGQLYFSDDFFDAAAGQTFLVVPQGSLELLAERPTVLGCLSLRGGDLPALLSATRFLDQGIDSEAELEPVRAALLRILETENTPAGAVQRTAGGYAIFARFFQNTSAVPVKDYARAAMEYLRKHFREPITVEQAAQSVGISRSWLYRAFMEYWGQPPAQFLRDLRLENAKSLLRHSSLSIQEVAYASGFSDPLYFSRVFSSVQGISPREFRRRQD